MLFIAALWFAGKLFGKFGMPELVGEIVFGIILGPHVLNLAGDHGSEMLIVIGEIGLVMLVVEAGVDVDIGMLKLIGPRGVGIAILGSIIPMSMGFTLSYLFMGTDVMTSIAIGACFAPTSMGIALKVLKGAKLLNTPTGQLIIASAILDDVIALIILSELQALADLTVVGILMPLIVSPVLILIIGYLAIGWIPKWIKMLMTKVSKDQRENGILALLFTATFVFVPMCHYLGSSHLLGAFLAGLCFCTDHTIHHVWHHQIKRVLQWMLRVFFAATIGFAIPILQFGSSAVIWRGLVYCIAGIGKVATGFFARPFHPKEIGIVGFSMSAWGEFAFILATASYAEGTLDDESFAAVLLAVLLSVIYSPYLLTLTISYYNKKQQKDMDAHLKKYENTNLHPLYFAINTKARGGWGHQDKILKKLFNLNLEIIDFRSWHAAEYNTTHHMPLTKDSFYIQDMETALPPTKHLDAHEKEVLLTRVNVIRAELRDALGEAAVISIKRWLPGVTKKDDELDPTDAYHKSMFGGDYKPKHVKTAEYCRQSAFKQAHSMISVFERRNTLEDLARKSKASLHSMYSDDENAGGRSRGMSDADRRHKTLTELGNLQSLSNLLAATSPKSQKKDKFSFDDKDEAPSAAIPKIIRQMSGHNVGQGNLGQTGAGGAGALPASSDIINIVNTLFGDDESQQGNKKRDASHMSYIYGDEESQHHKLPEYSADNAEMNNAAHFEPKLPDLAEDEEASHHEASRASTTYQTESHTKHTVIDVSLDQAQFEMNEAKDKEAKSTSPRNNMVIKIYPPSLQAVASKSPSGQDQQRYF